MNPSYFAPLLASLVASTLFAQEVPNNPSNPNNPTNQTKPGERLGAITPAKDPLRLKASQLIGCPITNSKNESLGEIEDIVLDGGNRHIAYAVVAFGGFLGMGEKYFAMPWRLIEIGQRSAEDTPRATLDLDPASLKGAPGFDKSKWPDMANADWSTQVDEHYRLRGEQKMRTGGTDQPKDNDLGRTGTGQTKGNDVGRTGNDPSKGNRADDPKGTGADGTRGVDREPGSKTFAHRRLSKLIGMDVVDTRNQEIAEVEDLVVETRHATIDGALLSFGGTLGMGEKLVLVAAEAMTLDPVKGVFVFPCTTAMLTTMALKDDKLPPLNDDAWRTKCLEMTNKARDAVGTSDVNAADASATKSATYADVYDVNKTETVKGRITTMGSVRVGEGQEERLRLRVRTAEGREMIVYAAPGTFADQQALALRSGQEIEVVGSPARYGSQTVLVAGSLTVDGKSVKLRDDQGRATWTKE